MDALDQAVVGDRRSRPHRLHQLVLGDQAVGEFRTGSGGPQSTAACRTIGVARSVAQIVSLREVDATPLIAKIPAGTSISSALCLEWARQARWLHSTTDGAPAVSEVRGSPLCTANSSDFGGISSSDRDTFRRSAEHPRVLRSLSAGQPIEPAGARRSAAAAPTRGGLLMIGTIRHVRTVARVSPPGSAVSVALRRRSVRGREEGHGRDARGRRGRAEDLARRPISPRAGPSAASSGSSRSA